MDDMPKIARSDGLWSVQPCFFITIWFQRERCEILRSVIIVGHVLSSMMKLVAENGMEAEI
jgi:hypothetical protein